MKEVRSRGWIFVVNNYTDDDIAYVSSLYEDDLNAKYLIVGFERGKRTGTAHLQCYIYYNEAISLKTAKDKFDPWHSECQRATKNVEAYVYPMKEYDYYEVGERPRQGHRTDLEVIKHDIEQAVSEKQIARNYFSQWCQYRKAFTEYRRLIADYDTEVIIYMDDDYEYLAEVFNKLYDVFDRNLDYIVLDYTQVSEHELLQIYYSRQYRYIFIPNRSNYRSITKLTDKYITANPIDV